jgi:hypothetical protein
LLFFSSLSLRATAGRYESNREEKKREGKKKEEQEQVVVRKLVVHPAQVSCMF